MAAAAQAGMDARGWDGAAYRRGILRERDLSCGTLFRAVFFDQHDDPSDPDVLLAAASSDGSLASFSLSSCVSPSFSAHEAPRTPDAVVSLVDPVCIVQAHSGPAYDVKFYPDSQQPLLFSGGDDGRLRGWRWHEMQSCLVPLSLQGDHLEPVLDLVNPQHEGPWGARSPIPENNAIAINKQEGSVYAAAGDACAYCWDVESGKCKMTFKGHTDYLHSIAVRVANRQILAVGAEPLLSPFSINGNLLSQIKCAPQSAFSVSIHSSGMAAVAGYGGLVDVISQCGSHLCTFGCRSLDK